MEWIGMNCLRRSSFTELFQIQIRTRESTDTPNAEQIASADTIVGVFRTFLVLGQHLDTVIYVCPQVALRTTDSEQLRLSVVDIVGGPGMRSIVWLKGMQLSNSDIYDSALCVAKTGYWKYCVPCVRVFAYNSNQAVRMQYMGDSHGSVCKKKVCVI